MNDLLLALEVQLRRVSSSVNLIAEIDLSPEHLEELRLGIKSLLRTHSFQAATTILKRSYPAAFVCYLVAEGIYSYKDGDYWGHIADNLGLHGQEPSFQAWGRAFEDILTAWKKPLFEDLQGHRYVSRILVHGGIPNFSLRDFFNHVLVPIVNLEDSLSFDLEEYIHDWLHFSSHRYQVDKPIKRFLQEGGQYARDFVSRCITMMRHYQSQQYLASAHELGIPERIVTAFHAWVQEQEPESKRSFQRFVRPQIWLDPYGQGVMVDLPAQTFSLSEQQDFEWEIKEVARYPVVCYTDGSLVMSKAQQQVLPYKGSYHIIFHNHTRSQKRVWEFHNDDKHKLLVFDGNSYDHIDIANKHLPRRKLWLLYPEQSTIDAPAGRCLEECTINHGKWQGFKASCWDLSQAEQIFINGTPIPTIQDLSNLRPYLSDEALFPYGQQRGAPPLYIRDLPQICIPISDTVDQEFVRWHLLVHDTNGASYSYSLHSLRKLCRVENNKIIIPLNTLGLRNDRLMHVQVSLRGQLGRDAHLRFSYLPQLDIVWDEKIRLPDAYGRYESTSILIETKPEVELRCYETNISALDRQVYEIDIPGDLSEITLIAKQSNVQIRILIALPRLVWYWKTHQTELAISRCLYETLDWLNDAELPSLYISVEPSYFPVKRCEISLEMAYRLGKIQLQAQANPQCTQYNFPLNQVIDEIRYQKQNNISFTLTINKLDTLEALKTYTTLHLSHKVIVTGFRCQSMLFQGQTQLRVSWRTINTNMQLQLLLWSLWQPWKEPIKLVLPESAINDASWSLSQKELPPGPYRAELQVNDRWQSLRPNFPYLAHEASNDFEVGRRVEQFSYLRRQIVQASDESRRFDGVLSAILAGSQNLMLEYSKQLKRIDSPTQVVHLLQTLLLLALRDPESWFELLEPQAKSIEQLLKQHYLLLFEAVAELYQQLPFQLHLSLEEILKLLLPHSGRTIYHAIHLRRLEFQKFKNFLFTGLLKEKELFRSLLNRLGIRLLEPSQNDGLDLVAMLRERIGEPALDSIRQYLYEIGSFPLLNADQERELAIHIERGKQAQAQLEKVQQLNNLFSQKQHLLKQEIQKGNEAREELIVSNLRLVVSVAKYYLQRMSLQDLIQEGNIGLLKAVDKFDYTKGHRFSTYATWWIKQAITRGISDQARLVRLPVHIGEFIGRIKRAEQELMLELDREPLTIEIAERLNTSEEKIRKTLSYNSLPLSLNQLVGEEESELLHFISDPNQAELFDEIDNEELAQQIKNGLRELTEREYFVLSLRYGLKDGHRHTLEEIGQILGLTRERVRQIEARAIRCLKEKPEFKQLRKDLELPNNQEVQQASQEEETVSSDLECLHQEAASNIHELQIG